MASAKFKPESVTTFLCFCLALDDVRVDHSGLQVSAFFGRGNEARDVGILQRHKAENCLVYFHMSEICAQAEEVRERDMTLHPAHAAKNDV